MLLTGALMLAGCGQRGDLYLPTPQKSSVPAATAPCTETATSGTTVSAPPCPKQN
jgi:predicted small lipoprotein YifL